MKTLHRTGGCSLFACLLFTIAPATVSGEVTLESLLREMVSRDAIARWPQPEWTCKQASSYDRKTVAPDQPGWFANGDHTQYIRSEVTDGRTEQVMLDVDGPGALVRFWLTTADNKQGTIRIYLDGQATPALTFASFDLLKGDLKVDKPLLEPHPGYGPVRGGNTLYLPIPYGTHCKVTWEEKGGGPRYYQINYRTYATGTAVKTFDAPQLTAARRTIDEINQSLISTTPETAGRAWTLEKPISAGKQQSLDLHEGTAAIRELELQLQRNGTALTDRELRSVIIQLKFDDETTVWCPAPDFFGSGVGVNVLRSWSRTVDANGVMRCRWVMPYQKKASITLLNLGENSVETRLRVVVAPWAWDDRSMHFYSAWHFESNLATPPDRDWNYIRIAGKGVYAGDSLALFNSVSTWYGEGDEKIRVDAEAVPSHLGTGTEDYYGYSFAPQGILQTPFVNQVRIDEPMTQGHNVMSRTRLLDGIPFKKSLDFDIELTAWQPTNLTYAATTYWYALPGATCNVTPQPKEATQAVPTLEQAKVAELASRPRKPGAIECEKMTVVDKTEGMNVGNQSMAPWGADRWSFGEHLIATGKGPGAFYELEVPASDQQPRQVVVYLTQANDYGILKFAVNGQPSTTTFDGYAEQVQPAGPVRLGVFKPQDGRFLLRAEITGANPKAGGPQFLFALDCVVLEDPTLKTVHGQPSLQLATPQVELSITQLGGHMSPVTFYKDSAKPIQPYYVSPWQDEPPKPMPVPVLVPLRGDFFCLPFGGNQDAVNGEKHPPHGETAGSRWESHGSVQRGKTTTLTMSLATQVRQGRVQKDLSLIEGQNVVYVRHLIEGFAGKVPLGHHATLAMPDREGAVRLAASPFRFGMTNPGLFSDPKQGEYQSLLPGAKWNSLSKVPVAWKDQPDADLTRLPARTGYADLIQLFNEPWQKTNGPAWMTATFAEDGFVWFALKDPAALNSTVFWIENHGRHGHPWNGRNNCLGLEDVTAFFADGLAASTKDNLLTKEGVATTVELKSDRPTSVNYIQGVVKIPAGFDAVKSIEFTAGQATFVSESGQRVSAPVVHEFIKTGQLP